MTSNFSIRKEYSDAQIHISDKIDLTPVGPDKKFNPFV